jgi:hypothetical protein
VVRSSPLRVVIVGVDGRRIAVLVVEVVVVVVTVVVTVVTVVAVVMETGTDVGATVMIGVETRVPVPEEIVARAGHGRSMTRSVVVTVTMNPNVLQSDVPLGTS